MRGGFRRLHTKPKFNADQVREGDTLRRRACGHCGRTFVTREYTDATLVIPRLLKKEPKQRTAKVTSNALFSAWN